MVEIKQEWIKSFFLDTIHQTVSSPKIHMKTEISWLLNQRRKALGNHSPFPSNAGKERMRTFQVKRLKRRLCSTKIALACFYINTNPLPQIQHIQIKLIFVPTEIGLYFDFSASTNKINHYFSSGQRLIRLNYISCISSFLNYIPTI